MTAMRLSTTAAAVRVLCLLALALQAVLPAVHPEHGMLRVASSHSVAADEARITGVPAAAAPHDAVACPVCAAARTGTAAIVDGSGALSHPDLVRTAGAAPAVAPAMAAARPAHGPRAPPFRS